MICSVDGFELVIVCKSTVAPHLPDLQHASPNDFSPAEPPEAGIGSHRVSGAEVSSERKSETFDVGSDNPGEPPSGPTPHNSRGACRKDDLRRPGMETPRPRFHASLREE